MCIRDRNNIGNATATNSYTIKMYISTDQNLSSNDSYGGEVPTANTAVGTDANVPGAITVPNVSDGVYYLILKVDSENDIQESNENNNIITSGQITIGSGGGGGGCDGSTSISGFTFIGEYGNSRYYFSDNTSRPTDAQATCQDNGGYLASISSLGENNFIQQGISGITYIGLNDEDSEGNLEWYSGENLNYSNIDICSFCNENTDNNDYGVMASWSGGWSWSNFWNQRQYIIEVPCATGFNGAPSSLIISNLGNDLNEAAKPSLKSVVPNPAEEFIYAKIESETEEVVEIQIFDARGSLVKTVSVGLYKGLVFEEINISDLPSGLYYMNIPQGQKKHSQLKFVKQRL